jgi:hypothetical protein
MLSKRMIQSIFAMMFYHFKMLLTYANKDGEKKEKIKLALTCTLAVCSLHCLL